MLLERSVKMFPFIRITRGFREGLADSIITGFREARLDLLLERRVGQALCPQPSCNVPLRDRFCPIGPLEQGAYAIGIGE